MREKTLRTWSSDIKQLGDQIVALTLSGAAELSAFLREVHNIEPATVEKIDPPPPEPTVSVPSVTEQSVYLEPVDASKRINLIRMVREITELTLKEARDLVASAPAAIKENISPEEAQALKAKLEEAGATVTIKP